MNRSAVFSDCGRFRWRLDRWWGDGPRALICMANPSMAGADRDDPTIHRCVALCRRPVFSVDGFTVVNWLPSIATSPVDLHVWRDREAREKREEFEAVCDANLSLIRDLAERASVHIVAWGAIIPRVPHTTRVLRALSRDGRHGLYAFDTTKDGTPKHPLARGRNRIVDNLPLVLWQRERALGLDLRSLGPAA